MARTGIRRLTISSAESAVEASLLKHCGVAIVLSATLSLNGPYSEQYGRECLGFRHFLAWRESSPHLALCGAYITLTFSHGKSETLARFL
jgi:hypothetical protein